MVLWVPEKIRDECIESGGARLCQTLHLHNVSTISFKERPVLVTMNAFLWSSIAATIACDRRVLAGFYQFTEVNVTLGQKSVSANLLTRTPANATDSIGLVVSCHCSSHLWD